MRHWCSPVPAASPHRTHRRSIPSPPTTRGARASHEWRPDAGTAWLHAAHRTRSGSGTRSWSIIRFGLLFFDELHGAAGHEVALVRGNVAARLRRPVPLRRHLLEGLPNVRFWDTVLLGDARHESVAPRGRVGLRDPRVERLGRRERPARRGQLHWRVLLEEP